MKIRLNPNRYRAGFGAILGTVATAVGLGVTVNNLVNPAKGPDGNPLGTAAANRNYYNENGGITSIPTYGNQAQAQRAGLGQNANPALQPVSAATNVVSSASQPTAAVTAPGISVTEELGLVLAVIGLGAAIFLHRKK